MPGWALAWLLALAGPASAQPQPSWLDDLTVANKAAYTAMRLEGRPTPLNQDGHLNLPTGTWQTGVRLAAEGDGLALALHAEDMRATPAEDGLVRGRQSFAVEKAAITPHLPGPAEVTLGKTTLPWDPAKSFKPLGFFQASRPAPAYTLLPRREGVPLAAATWHPPGLANTDLTAVASHRPGYRQAMHVKRQGPDSDALRDARRIDHVQAAQSQLALRLGYDSDWARLASVARTATGAPLGAGGSLAVAPGRGVWFYASGFAGLGHNRLRNAMLEPGAGDYATRAPFSRTAQNDGKLYPRAVLGLRGEPATEAGLAWHLEASYDSRGLSRQDWQRWTSLVDAHSDPPASVGGDLARRNLTYDAMTLGFGPARRAYTRAGLSYVTRGWELELWNLWGVADDSLAAGGRLLYAAGPRLAWGLLGHGRTSLKSNGEFARHPYAGALGGGLRLSF